jgi:DNA topoisomerase-1
VPNEGPKTDPAHPAVHATGELPKKLTERDRKLYDLVVRRTLATFADPATNESMTIIFDVNKELFIAKGQVNVVQGWYAFYDRYVNRKDVQLPSLKEGDQLKNQTIEMHEDQTKPPKRYTPASIIKELEKRNLGTKSTRASIIDTLYQRQYVNAQSIEATELGIKTVETLEKYCPEILDEHLTRHFEEETELVREDKKTKEEILKEAQEFLTKALTNFKQHEKKIGEALLAATRTTQTELSRVTQCPLCKEGDLSIRYSPRFKSYFLGCSKYPACKNTSSLPSGLPKPSTKVCKECGSPEVIMIRQGKRPFNYCINKQCKLKVDWLKQQQEEQVAKEAH